MGLQLITPPPVEPVALQELKEFLRVDADDTTQDNLLNTLCMAARSWCEVFTGRRFVLQTWALFMDFFPGYIDERIVGSSISSPFVSGANAILVGIRYAIALPLPPAVAVLSFVYQNATGQITSMIVGPIAIAAVANPLNQAISINTTLPHGLVTGATVLLAGNAPLLALLGAQASQVITVTDPNDFTFNGSLGTGATIAAAGTVTGFNYVQDVVSNPARLTPLFGQMWPVARVVVNAIQVTFTCGYAMPITVSMDGTTGIITGSYTFLATDVGRPISIPGAADLNGGPLNTVIASVTDGAATTRDVSAVAVEDVTALLVNSPNANPAHWELFKIGIKLRTAQLYENRVLGGSRLSTDDIKELLWPARAFRL